MIIIMDLTKFIDSILKNRNGKLEGQRLTESWFLKNDYNNQYEFFKKNDLFDRKRLYMFHYNESDKCPNCLNSRRFKGFSSGFVSHCEQCSRSKFNFMKKVGSKRIELTDVIQHVRNSNGYSSTRIKQLSDYSIRLVEKRTNYLKKNVTLSERLYHIEHELYELPKCKLCSKDNTNFLTSKVGYHKYCKSKCSYIYNKKERLLKLKTYYYYELKRKFENQAVLLDNDIEFFSLNDYLNNPKDALMYITHRKCSHRYSHGYEYQGHFKCPKCYPIRSRVQYDVFEFVSKFSECLFNDRKMIKPKEIDILVHSHRFGIEYDSISYHSFGYHAKKELNNLDEDQYCHLRKTELLEQQNYQLFRIFSNEWYNKQNVWKTIISSKFGINKYPKSLELYSKYIPHKKANDFFDLYSLERLFESNICIGTYHNSELLDVTAFKEIENNVYELKHCSKIGFNIRNIDFSLFYDIFNDIKQIKIIRYIDRRYDNGSFLEQQGFKLVKLIQPLAYYFKGGDTSEFDITLTNSIESNLFELKYRKIYDCGLLKYEKMSNL